MARVNLREKILDSAVVEFHRLGFNGCSVEDITSHADTPKGSFYNHFKSKEELAAAVIDAYVESVPSSMLHDKTLSPLKRIERHFSEMVRPFIDSGYERGCLLGNFANEVADHSPMLRKKLKESFANWATMLAEAIRDGQSSGEISTLYRPEVWASFLLSAYEGALLRTRTTREAGVLREFETVALKLLARKTDRA